MWMLGYAGEALANVEQALSDAREMGHAPTLMFALIAAPRSHLLCGNLATARALLDELASLADEKGAFLWKSYEMFHRGYLSAQDGKFTDAVRQISSGIAAARSTGSTWSEPFFLPILAKSYADIGNFDDAWRCVGEASAMINRSKEAWCEAELDRLGGEIVLASPQRDEARAEAFFQRALSVARQQQARSWELRAAVSLARLWRDQGKSKQARDLLTPVYGWFTEGFDTLDLKEAKALLQQLAA